jgi:hypothetical protein
MTGEIAWLAASIIAGGIATGILAGLFGGGAVIVPVLYEVFRVFGVPDSVRMQLCLGTSLAIIVPTTLRSYRAHKNAGVGASRCRATLGVAVDDGRCGRLGSRGNSASRNIQGSVCRNSMCYCREVPDWRLTLGRWHRTAWCSGDEQLWLRHWPGLVTDGDRRRVIGDDGADPLRQADPHRPDGCLPTVSVCTSFGGSAFMSTTNNLSAGVSLRTPFSSIVVIESAISAMPCLSVGGQRRVRRGARRGCQRPAVHVALRCRRSALPQVSACSRREYARHHWE